VDTLPELERALLVRPLDADVRLQYARALASGDRHQDALAQFDLLTTQTGVAGAAHAGAAACLLALGRRGDALARYDTGRPLEGFAPHPDLEAAAAAAPSSGPTRLKVIQGGADNVVSIARAPADRASTNRIGFDDIAGLDDLKRTMRLQIIEPFLRPGLFAKFRKRAGGGVLILAATNMPWDVDSAMKRPGRFTRQVFVAPPDPVARARIVDLKLEGVPHVAIDAGAIAAATPHFSGADIEGVVELAKDYVLEEHITSSVERSVRQADLLRAARAAKASTLDWLRTARNLVKYAGGDDSYRDLERYLKANKLL
jgi:hypothetical protein